MSLSKHADCPPLGKVKCVVTRKDTEQWLVGYPIDCITGCKLPSIGQAFRRLLQHHKVDKKPIRESAGLVVDEVLPFWEKARIPTQFKVNIVDRLQNMYQQTYQGLRKSKSRTGAKYETERSMFVDSLEELFDVAHEDAEKMISNPEDWAFLQAQREKGRRGAMTSKDFKLAEKEKRREVRKSKEAERKRRSDEEKNLMFVKVKEEEAEENEVKSDSDNLKGKDEDFLYHGNHRAYKRKKVDFLTPEIVAAMQRTKTTTRNAKHLFESTVKSHFADNEDVKLSYGTLYNTTKKYTSQLAAEIKENFNAGSALVVHWDGKILKDLLSGNKVDRLAILVSCGSKDQLLNVPIVKSGRGTDEADAVIFALREWNLVEHVVAMCFDTTSSNTGRKGGACVLIESRLGKDLLYLACRHHVFELVLEAAFDQALGHANTPDIHPLFPKFQKFWSTVDKDKFTGLGRAALRRFPVDPDDVIKFCEDQLNVNQPRDDYKELLQLTIIFLGGVPPGGISFRKPGAINKTRWMARAVYAFKMYLFQKQFITTCEEKKGLEDICIFISAAYVRVWFQCPNAVMAPHNDLEFLKLLKSHEQLSKSWAAALTKFSSHLWYLCSELVSLAFFDERVPVQVKRDMIINLISKDSVEDPPKRAQILRETVSTDLTLAYFVDTASNNFFKILKMSGSYLQKDPLEWNENEDYVKDKEIARSMRVVNDNAERGIKLITDYCNILTKDDNQKQELLLVVAAHREAHKKV